MQPQAPEQIWQIISGKFVAKKEEFHPHYVCYSRQRAYAICAYSQAGPRPLHNIISLGPLRL
jgi:hypothetical protein